MPLRDHFQRRVNRRRSWEGLHGGWPMVIVQSLRNILPPRYIAEPRVHLGAQVEIDVATLERSPLLENASATAAPATAWALCAPTLEAETEFADVDEYEVRVYDLETEERLVAAIEIISPSNKDRPESRSQFIGKCAALLRQHVSVVLVDLVSVRKFNLYSELLELVDRRDSSLGENPPATYAASCRWRPRGQSDWLEAWAQSLSVGQPLPVLPLWLSDELAIPLDLEASYEQTCRDLRME